MSLTKKLAAGSAIILNNNLLLKVVSLRANCLLKEIEVMKTYFTATATLFTCIATVVRAAELRWTQNSD